MANPFTRFLRSLGAAASSNEVARFVGNWDIVEAIVVDVNRRKRVLDEEREAYAAARATLLEEYERIWAPRFASHWPETWEAGSPTASDPFLRLLSVESADGFTGNWPAMQALASAREALNRYILTLKA